MHQKKIECCGCGACVDGCPTGALRMRQDWEGFFYPELNMDLCMHCGRCEAVCPVRNPDGTLSCETEISRVYMGAQAKNHGIRFSSASGGVFPILAGYVLRQQGSVYGAVYDRDMRVVHREIRDEKRLKKMQGSKYVQSDLTGIYRSIENRLKAGKWVLFCGTPCQAHGLRLFLNRSYERLIVVDLVCNGVPSPGIWNANVKYLEGRMGGKLKDFSFRDKRNHDNGHTCSGRTGDREYAVALDADAYCRMYVRDYISRPSCYACPFCTVERDSDITIGDFWGIEQVKPEVDDKMGISLVMLHSEQGRKVWESVKNELFWFFCEEKDLIQPRLILPARRSGKRHLIMLLYRLLPFWMLVWLAGRGTRHNSGACVRRMYSLQESGNRE